MCRQGFTIHCRFLVFRIFGFPLSSELLITHCSLWRFNLPFDLSQLFFFLPPMLQFYPLLTHTVSLSASFPLNLFLSSLRLLSHCPPAVSFLRMSYNCAGMQEWMLNSDKGFSFDLHHRGIGVVKRDQSQHDISRQIHVKHKLCSPLRSLFFQPQTLFHFKSLHSLSLQLTQAVPLHFSCSHPKCSFMLKSPVSTFRNQYPTTRYSYIKTSKDSPSTHLSRRN